jgi:hypothetical protein
VVFVPESAPEKAALFHGRWLRVFILVAILLGGFFAIVYLSQSRSAPVKASITGKAVEPPATQPAQILPKEPISGTVPLSTALPHRVAGSTYLQLSATHQQSAELLIDGLRKKNFEAAASEIEGRPGLVRVLVGPVRDTDVVQLRADLERAGFAGNAAVRRTLAGSNPPEPDNAISSSARTTNERANNRPLAQPAQAESDPANTGAAKPLPAEAAKEDASNRAVVGQGYLEFRASSRQAAEIISDALHEKGFDATAPETEDSPGVFRVLVRPVNDISIDQLRADLERAGFHGNAAIFRFLK